ncbi:MAG: phospho-N-acetylmuramoyl-pentapeptide-transferase, partial [Clostridia bacterium]|nr:phospho-N-acetylmuramoyl-pentapeptide-transferase [Clostridia bacterium]
MGLTAVIAFLATAVLGRILIPLLRKLKFGQTVRDNGPQSHLVKMGIPTMGGLMFLIPVIVLFLIFNRFNFDSIVISLTVLFYALIGFLDDFIKIRKKSKDGLSVLQKSIGLLLVSGFFSVYFVYFSGIGTDIIIPFSQMEQSLIIPKLLYVVILIITLYLTTNAVNLTDGVDGLASSVTTVVLMLFLFIGYSHADNQIISYLCLASIGGLMAFLLYNAYPAKVIMGDTGSMTLGAIVTISAIYLKIPWIIL